jgi:hypothetical protein
MFISFRKERYFWVIGTALADMRTFVISNNLLTASFKSQKCGAETV